MLGNNRMSQNFGRVLLTNIKDTKVKGFSKVPVYTEEEYMVELAKREKTSSGLCEFVGLSEFQVKPYFDLDPKDDIDYSIFDEFENDIKKICNKEVFISGRDPREEEWRGKITVKHSRRFYLKARITYSNIPIVFKELFDKYKDFIDDSVYSLNRRLFTPLTTKKRECEVPKLKLIKGSIFDCCASYIEEDYEDLDLKVKVPEEDKLEFKLSLYDDDNETVYDGNLNFHEIVMKLSKERATEYKSWFYVGVALINLFYRKIISRGQIYDFFDTFSSKADNYNAMSVANVLDINIPRFDGKGYGIKYLLECLKIDDNEYYKKITQKDLIIDGANDDIGASELVIKEYNDLLVVCKGILYVKFNDVWICNPIEVDRILIDMIGKLEIKFFGADGKRKYYYNKSIKHIKDCIVCIKANQNIINNKFYDDMIKNNKYYLPFNDGIYSFKDKKLYQYRELPNVHFTYKINRNFPKFDKKSHDDLMNKVIIPIYPDEQERNYNAHIKARALSGCYEDKKWYGYSGSRNSGKGTETGLLRSSFGDFVLEFNAKCLIFNKFGNPEPAKALGWVVDKKDARIIISNEIDGDDETKLNGAFIKTLASGGDAMEGRRLYENSISFIPQFTMFLCYNKFYEVVPSDAKENLEQFEYKSKFVSKEDLLPNIPFLKLRDDNIKDFIKEDRIIDAYTLYILNAFSNPRMDTPESVKISTNINNGETEISAETFILQNFKTTTDSKDRLHTEDIKDILNEKGYKIDIREAGRLMNRTGIGKYNDKCNINKVRKGGFEYIKYIQN